VSRLHEELLGKTEDYEQISNELAQLETKYATQEELRERLVKDWADEKKRLEGKIKALADASFEGDIEDNTETTRGFDMKTTVGFGGERGPTFSTIEVESNEHGLTVVTHPLRHSIKVNAAITKNEETGETSILAKAFWIQKESTGYSFGDEWLDKPYPLNITGGSIVIDPTSPIDPRLKPRFLFAPHVNMGLFAGMAGPSLKAGVHVDVTLGGYGLTKNDLDFKLGGIGLNGGDSYLDFNVVPVYYRVGNHIPLVSDLYIGPGVGFGTGGVNYFLVLGTTL
jgi:hypothetical protein